MKYILFIFLACIIFSCSKNKSKPIPTENVIKYDTIIIDYDKENEVLDRSNAMYSNLNIPQIIDSLQKLSVLQGIMEINEEGLPFTDYQTLGNYYVNNIPRPIYQKIFPKEEINIEKRRFSNPQTINKEHKVIVKKGLKITEERKYKTLLSLIIQKEYIQAIITKQGKFTPEIDLFTLSKNDLSVIDHEELYGGIYDSYDIDYWHSSFEKDYQKFIKTRVINTERVDVKLDTSYIDFSINNQGIITSNKL